MSASAKLSESWAHHAAYRAAVKLKDEQKALESLQAAYDARLAAVALDAGQTDPAWQAEQAKTRGADTHRAMMDFYEFQLAKRT